MKSKDFKLIINAASEACREPVLRQKLMKLYNELPDVYDEYAEKIPASVFTRKLKEAYTKDNKYLKELAGVYAACELEDRLCKDKVLDEIKSALKIATKPVASLFVTHDINMDIEEALISYSERLVANWRNTLTIYREKRGIPIDEEKNYTYAYEGLFADINCVNEICKDIDESREADIVSFDTENPFYLGLLDNAKSVFNSDIDDTMIYVSSEVDRISSYSELEDFYEYSKKYCFDERPLLDLGLMQEYEDYMINKNGYTIPDILYDLCENDFEKLLIEECVRATYEYRVEGIDIIPALKLAKFSGKTVNRLVKKAYQSMNILIGEPNSLTDKRFYARAVVDNIFDYAVYAERDAIYSELLKERKSPKKESESRKGASKKIVDELRDTIDSLEQKVESLENKAEYLEKDRKSLEKMHLNEEHDLKLRIKELEDKYEPEMAAALPEVDDMCSSDGSETDEDKVNVLSEEEFGDFISQHKILCWGLRPEIRKRYEGKYPELGFIDSDRDISAAFLSQYDGIIVKADYTCHPKYFSMRDRARTLDIPFICMDNNWSSDARLRQAAYTLRTNILAKNKSKY